MPRVTVWATVALPGFHHWPDAPAHRAYLASTHRHLFHLRAEVSVDHSDRAVEFHDLADEMRTWWEAGPDDRDAASCEDIAAALWAHLALHGYKPVSITVAEDGENGATLREYP